MVVFEENGGVEKLFDKMALVIEENRLKERFNITVAKAIVEVLEKETPEKYIESIFNVLKQFNDIVKIIDKAIGFDRSDSEWKIYDEEMQERYMNILLGQLNTIFIRLGKMNFLQKFSDVYWKQNQNFILQLWKKLPEGESIISNEASFIKLFEDFFSETIKTFPEFIVKRLKDFHNIYRASRYEVYDNYKYIMPDPKYCHDNRWNDDGIAFLYLSYDNENQKCENVFQAQRTCFEEIRAKDGEEIAVCRFKYLHNRIKILDLSFDDIDYDKEIGRLEELSVASRDKIMGLIQSNTKIRNRMIEYAKTNDEKAFIDELDRIENKIGIKKEMREGVQLQLSKVLIGNICDAIFYAVDKEDDPELEAYIPFRAFSRYLIANGFGGVAYRSTRMAKIGLRGKCLTLFDKNDAMYMDGEMEVYQYHRDGCKFIKKY